MAKYPIKMLKDEEGTPFVPLVSTEALRTPEGETIEEKLEKKLEVSNIKAGTDISLSVDGNNIIINNASKGVLIDNLDTETSGLGSLDAHQGKVLKDMIPDVVNNLTTVSTDKALSAYQGYLLNHRVVPTGGTTGQVLKKSSNDDHALEWGDAADPNAIIGDGSIKKIIELTYEEYQALETIDPDTEYHIYNVEDGTYTYISEGKIQEMINNTLAPVKIQVDNIEQELDLRGSCACFYMADISDQSIPTAQSTIVKFDSTDYIDNDCFELMSDGRILVKKDISRVYASASIRGGYNTKKFYYLGSHSKGDVANVSGDTGTDVCTVSGVIPVSKGDYIYLSAYFFQADKIDGHSRGWVGIHLAVLR